MPKFSIRSSNTETTDIEAPDWSSAISTLVGRFRRGGNTVHVNVNESGEAEVWDEDSDMRFMVDVVDGPLTGFEISEDPTADLWDAPHPGSGAKSASEPNDLEYAEMQNAVSSLAEGASDTAACEDAINLLLTHVPAESGSILLAEGTLLRFTAVRGPHATELKGSTIAINKGIAGAVANSGRAVMVREARHNPQYDASIDHSLNHVTRTLLAVPIEADGSVVGVLELLNPFGADSFQPWHQQFARDVADTLARRFLRR